MSVDNFRSKIEYKTLTYSSSNDTFKNIYIIVYNAKQMTIKMKPAS